MLSRRAVTLAELLVALVLAGVLLGMATASLLRQQRSHARVVAVTDGDAQSRAAMLVLASQLALLDPVAGDLASGQAADSAIQFRALVASSLACATEPGTVTLLPESGDSLPLGSTIADARPGDTLWWLGDTLWRAAGILSTAAITTACGAPVNSAGMARHVVASAPDTIRAGTPVRITRQARFSVYRASDGTWQLGYREWSASTNRFAAPQPVVGPLVPPSASRPSGFRYFDSTGAELLAAAGPVDVRRIARIRLTARAYAQGSPSPQDSVRADSVDVPLRRGIP